MLVEQKFAIKRKSADNASLSRAETEAYDGADALGHVYLMRFENIVVVGTAISLDVYDMASGAHVVNVKLPDFKAIVRANSSLAKKLDNKAFPRNWRDLQPFAPVGDRSIMFFLCGYGAEDTRIAIPIILNISNKEYSWRHLVPGGIEHIVADDVVSYALTDAPDVISLDCTDSGSKAFFCELVRPDGTYNFVLDLSEGTYRFIPPEVMRKLDIDLFDVDYTNFLLAGTCEFGYDARYAQLQKYSCSGWEYDLATCAIRFSADINGRRREFEIPVAQDFDQEGFMATSYEKIPTAISADSMIAVDSLSHPGYDHFRVWTF